MIAAVSKLMLTLFDDFIVAPLGLAGSVPFVLHCKDAGPCSDRAHNKLSGSRLLLNVCSKCKLFNQTALVLLKQLEKAGESGIIRRRRQAQARMFAGD